MSDAPGPDELPSRLSDAVRLGAGAFGEVYRAVDASGRPVAVKVLAAALAARADVAWQFTGEYRKLARLAHPAFPKAYEEGRTPAGLPYYTMELVEGHPPAGQDVRALLLAVAEALAYLHDLGWVHGDLKPENLRVLPDGRVKLLDVGLMAPVGQKREAIAGTLEYLAPEAIRRAPVAPAADLYALGALAYELLAGRPPFTGTPGELVRAQLAAPVPSLVTPDAELAALVLDLLAKEPAARPASARAVMARLGATVDPALLESAGGLQGAAFIGRRDVLDAWGTALVAGAVVRFAGGTGLGKSRTLDELRVQAQLAGKAWAGAACVAGDAPGAPVRALVGQVLALAARAPSELVGAWLAGSLPPELADVEPATRAVMLHAAAAEALAAAATTLGGVALGLDDLHLADAATRDFVGYWQRTASAPVAWAIASAEEADALALTPFDTDEASRFVASRLGESAPAEVLAALAPAAGNPLLLDLLLEHLASSGRLRRAGGHWTLVAGTGGELPTSLEAAWEARFAGLSAAARELAAVSAVALPAGALPPQALGRALTAAEALEGAVDELVAEGVLALEGGRVRLALPALGEFFARQVATERRAAWAGLLAEAILGGALAGVDAAALDTDVLLPAARLALAGPDALSAAHLAAEAGRRALALGATGQALELLAAGLERLPADAPTELALALRFNRAEAERFLDRLDEARADYEAAVPLAADDALAARALNGLAKVRQLQNAFDDALALTSEATERARLADDAGQEARAAITEARIRHFQGSLPDALAAAERAVARARAGQARVFLALGLTLLGGLLTQQGPEQAPRATGLLGEALVLAEAIGDRLGVGLAQENLGNTRLSLGDLLGAMDGFTRCAATFQSIGKDTEALSAGLNLAIVAGERGVPEAVMIADDVDRRARAVGRKFPQVAAKTVLGQMAWRQGRPAEVFGPLDDALALAVEIKNKYLEEHVRLYRLEAWLQLGQREAAREEALLVRAIASATGHAEALARLSVLDARLAWLDGDAEAARTAIGPSLGAAHQGVAHAALSLLAEIELAAGRPAQALAAATGAAELARGWSAPWHEVAAEAQIARARVGMGDRAEAVSLARSAQERAAGAGNPYARAQAALVVALGGMRGDDSTLLASAVEDFRPVVAGLAPEARAALLAAQGLGALADGLARVAAAPTGTFGPAALAAAMQAVALESTEDAIAEAVLNAAVALVQADRGYVLSYEGGRLRQAVTSGLDYDGEAARFSHSIAERVLFGGEAVYVVDASADAAWREAASVMALALKTVIGLPMAVGSEMLGVLYLEREALEPVLASEDVQLLASLASFATALVVAERGRLAASRGRLCAGLGARLAAGQAPRNVQAALVAAAVEAAGGQRGLWLEPSGDGWEVTLALDARGQAIAGSRPSQGIARWVAERGEPLAILDTSSDTAWEQRQSVQALGLQTVWCLPAGSALLYVDAPVSAEREPLAVLRALEELVRFAMPLLGVDPVDMLP